MLTTEIADVGCRQTRDNGREVAAFANVASGDLETQSRMRTSNGLRHRIQTVKWVVGNREVQRGQHGALKGRSGTIGRQTTEDSDIPGNVRLIVHALIEAGVSGSLDKVDSTSKVVQDQQGTRVPKEIPRRELGTTRP